MEIDKIYQELTGVNINEQKILWDERGKGYYGEYLIFKDLFYRVDNISKILMNLEIPTPTGKKTEIDLVLIMESGIYVFESKHYKGTIYGQINDDSWIQWFKTKKSSHFNNPVKQNQYHIDNLKRIFPDIPIYSYVVFTNHEDCTLKIDTRKTGNITVCEINSLLYDLNNDIQTRTKVLSLNDIENIFRTLIPYAPIMETELKFGEEKITLNDYIHRTVKECIENKNRIKQDYNRKCIELKNQATKYKQDLEQKHKKVKKRTIIIGVVITLLISFVMSFLSFVVVVALNMNKQERLEILESNLTTLQETLNNEKEELKVLEDKYNELIQKFESVENIQIDPNNLKNDLAYFDSLVLENSKIANNTVDFSCKLYSINSENRIVVMKDTTITVVLNNGEIKEFKVFNEQYPYSSDVPIGTKNQIMGSRTIATHLLTEMNKEDIKLVKLTKLGVRKYTQENIWGELLYDNYEMILYSK